MSIWPTATPVSPNGKPPGVFAMQYGPGSENAFPGIATTFSDSVPVLFLPLAQARDQSQIFPTFRSAVTYASVIKQVEEIRTPGSVTDVMRRAYAALKNGRPGPVMVEVPRDLVNEETGFDSVAYTPIRPTDFGGRSARRRGRGEAADPGTMPGDPGRSGRACMRKRRMNW